MRNDNLIHSLDTNIEELFAFVGSIKNERIMIRKDGNCLSIYDHIRHLSLIQEPLYKRIKCFIEEDKPEIENITLGRIEIYDTGKIEEIHLLMRAFEKWRKMQVESVKSTNGKLWDKNALIRSCDIYTFEQLIKDIILADDFHMKQIQELKVLRDEIMRK